MLHIVGPLPLILAPIKAGEYALPMALVSLPLPFVLLALV
jgi:hypothetical protein